MNYEAAFISGLNHRGNSESRTSSASSFNEEKELARNKSQEFKIQPTDEPHLRFRKTVFLVLTDPKFGILGRLVSIFLTITIIWCAISFSLETVFSLNKSSVEKALWRYNEIVISLIFTFEYFLRIAFFPSFKWLPGYIFSVSWMIDFITILPFYLTIFFEDTSGTVIGIIRLTRVLRMIRLLKISQNTTQVKMVFEALIRSRDAVLMLAFLITNCLFLYGSCVYFAELSISNKDDNGILYYSSGSFAGRRSGFQSIPHSMWWAMVTLTTVGYGDMVPMSGWGKLIGGMTMFTGLLVVAFPITILSMNMTELYEEYRAKSSVKQQVSDQKLQNILHLQDKVYGQPSILLPEQIDLLRIMLEDLIKTENQAMRMENNIEHVLDEISDVKLTLRSFSGHTVIDDDAESYCAIPDIAELDTNLPIESIQTTTNIKIPLKTNPFLDE